MKYFKCLNISVLWFFICLLSFGLVTGQNLEEGQVNSDSLLEANIQEGEKLKSQIDSSKIADSIIQQELLRRIKEVKNKDSQETKRLKNQLDSLKRIQGLKEEVLSAKVDSLRKITPGIPVVLYDDTLFRVYSKIGPFSPKARVKSMVQKIENLVDEGEFHSDSLLIFESMQSLDIYHGDVVIHSITNLDASWAGISRKELGEDYLQKIQSTVKRYQDRNSIWMILIRSGLILVVIAAFIGLVRLINLGFGKLVIIVEKKALNKLKGIKIRNYEIVSVDQMGKVVHLLLVGLKWLTIVILFYVSLPILFSIFPATKGIAATLIGYILEPVKSIGIGLIGFIPELIAIVVILLVAHYFISFLFFLAKEVQTEKLKIPGFYPDWARPTFNILRILVYAFTLIIIFPYLPGSDSPIFRGVSVFLGILFSLGSSSAIGNIIAGLVITYMRAFKVGDRVKIGDITGDVIEKSMLVTRLRTIKNEEVTIPNSSILNGSTVNYTASVKKQGLILNTSVTIGYDVSRDQVTELLIGAAIKCDRIKKDPPPFVFHTSLDDFYVSYQINAYTDYPEEAASIYSEIHGNILDSFNAAQVEILSPHYQANRDGSAAAIPKNNPGSQGAAGV